MSNDLSEKQLRFIDEFIIDLNAKRAAIRAGYSGKTAEQQGSRLLSNAKVRDEIERRKTARSEETKIDAAWVLKRLAAEAEADIADLYGPDGQLLPVKEWPKIWRQGLVAGVDVEEIHVEGVKMGEVKKIRLSDRIRRLELIGKHVKVNAFQEVVQHKGLEGLADRLARAKKRVK